MAKGDKYKGIAEEDHRQAEATKLRLSFDFVQWDDVFFLHGLEPEYYKKLIETFSEVKGSTENQILQQNHDSLVPKSIFNTDSSLRLRFPEDVEIKIAEKLKKENAAGAPDDSKAKAKNIIDRAFEIRVGKNYGRIHAFVWDKVFHIVWFDPAHNLYSKKTGVRKAKEYATVKGFSPEAVKDIRDENQRLTDAYNELQEKLEAKEREYDELYQAFADK